MLTRVLFLLAAMTLGVNAQSAEPPPYHVEIEGDGRPVYLIPGLASPGSVWDDLAGRLRERGYQARMLTLAGFAGLPPLRGDALLPEVRDALAAEIQAQDGAKPVLVGHSLGGFMAFWLAATIPDSVAGIVAVDGVPYISALTNPTATPAAVDAQAQQIRQYMSNMTPEQYAAQNRATLAGMIGRKDKLERIAEAVGQSTPSAVGTAMAEMMTTDLRPLMRRIQVPVVLIQAADSGASEFRRAAYAAQVEPIADVRHTVADKGLHFVPLDDPEFVAREVIGLLERVENE